MAVSGKATISVAGNTEEIEEGQTLLIPAENKEVQISSDDCELLEVSVNR